MPIVTATGAAQAASPNRSRGKFAAEMELAMVNAIKQAALDGVMNPDEIKARISAARSAVKARYTDQ
jgi:hypothetical protein